MPQPDLSAFGTPSPSGLTPFTRSEAEAAFTSNTLAQVDSAAPDATLREDMLSSPNDYGTSSDSTTEAQKAYRRPTVQRASSMNYELALKKSKQESASSNMSTHDVPERLIGEGANVPSPVDASTVFPPPGKGVVPLNYAHVGAVRGEAIKKTRLRGLSLSGLAQQQGWSEAEFRRVCSVDVLEGQVTDGGYSVGEEHKTQ